MKLKEAVFLLFCTLLIHHVGGIAENLTSSSTTSTDVPITTPLSPQQACEHASASCEECVKITKCYYCTSSKKCEYYPYNHIFPKSKECEMGDIRWAVCWFNFKAMIISIGVVGGLLVVSCLICICCCCRKKKKNSRLIQENAKREREREERRIRNQERQKERETKYNEIRRKYGLMKDETHPYQRFEA